MHLLDEEEVEVLEMYNSNPAQQWALVKGGQLFRQQYLRTVLDRNGKEVLDQHGKPRKEWVWTEFALQPGEWFVHPERLRST